MVWFFFLAMRRPRIGLSESQHLISDTLKQGHTHTHTHTNTTHPYRERVVIFRISGFWKIGRMTDAEVHVTHVLIKKGQGIYVKLCLF